MLVKFPSFFICLIQSFLRKMVKPQDVVGLRGTHTFSGLLCFFPLWNQDLEHTLHTMHILGKNKGKRVSGKV